MKNKGKLILIVLGIALLVLGFKGLMDIPKQKAVLEAAVYLDEAVAFPENEGKLVIVHGIPEMLSPAHDKELGLTLNTIKAIRHAEEYKMVSQKDGVEKFQWAAKGSVSIIGEAALGEFVLDEKTISAFSADKDYEDFDAAELSANGYTTAYTKTTEGAHTSRLCLMVGGAYYYDAYEYNPNADVSRYERELSNEIIEERQGAKAYTYKIHDTSSDAALTIAGIQRGTGLVADETVGPIVRSGVLTKEQVLSSNSNSMIGGAAVFMSFGILLIVLGLRKPKSIQKGK